ncbi:hypothetical protein GP486_003638 [Trichoglossum hirsutum]|uniref:Uncharacterized protein n=1 Tax=Trichoglossum hirsutum TaxID=265104 RepID=A0A9P8RQD5_9PEZI|nr:hypothetical protein GP486_003638 [Trichoglossum hirsutum]
MQNTCDTIDPKLLDRRWRPSSPPPSPVPASIQNDVICVAAPVNAADGEAEETTDLESLVGSEQRGRHDSLDQLDILGHFEFSSAFQEQDAQGMHLRQTPSDRRPRDPVRNLNYVGPWTPFRALEPPSPVSSPSQWDLWREPQDSQMELESISPTGCVFVSKWAHDTAEFPHTYADQSNSPAIDPTGPTAEPQAILYRPNKPGYPTPESSLSKIQSSLGAATTARYDTSPGDSHSDPSVTFLVGSQFEAASGVTALSNGPPYSQPMLHSVLPNDCGTVVSRNAAQEASLINQGEYEKRVHTPQHTPYSWPDEVSCEVSCECYGPSACVGDSRHDYDSLLEHRVGGSIPSGFSPEYQSEAVVTQPRSIPLPEVQLAGSVDRHLRLALRQERREAKPARRHTTSSSDRRPLLIIQEDGHGGITRSSGAFKKGVRKGHLSKEKAGAVAEKRKQQNCDGDSPCQRCSEISKRVALGQPCVKAQFLDIVESGTCNYISQRAINHLTLDKSNRIQMFLPKTFELSELLDLVKHRRHRFNFRARQMSGSLYVLNLAKCYDFLTAIGQSQPTQRHDLRDFIDNTLVRTPGWLECVSDCDPMNGVLEELPDRPLNAEDLQDREEILIAAQLSRIVCRKLEIDGFKVLQKTINSLRFEAPDGAAKFVRELGQILLTLRWRISWWELLGDGSNEPDPSRDRYVDRVRCLSRVLYFYYFTAKRRVSSWNAIALEGVLSVYADAAPIFDDFPRVESIGGFHNWMEQGKQLVCQAGVQRRLSQHQTI